MITFWMPRDRRFGIEHYLGRYLPSAYSWVSITSYEDIRRRLSTCSRAHVFSSLDRMSEPCYEAVDQMTTQLASQKPDVRLLNRPGHTLGRYEQLHRLHEAGLNSFRVFRLDEDWAQVTFPAFIMTAGR